MKKTLRGKLTYANVISTLCLFLLLGGGAAFAASHLGKNSVGTKQLKKNSVTASKIKNGAVTGAKIKDGTIPGSKVENGTLTGAQIEASTLGKVPSAARADSADSAGNGAQRIDFSGPRTDPAPAGPTSPAVHQLLNLGGLTLSASCINAGAEGARVYVTFGSSVNGPLTWNFIRFLNPGFESIVNGTELGPTANPSYPVADLTGGDRFLNGQWIFRSATRTITVALHVGAGDFELNQCEVQGTALVAGS
jgi:hypothetical protein